MEYVIPLISSYITCQNFNNLDTKAKSTIIKLKSQNLINVNQVDFNDASRASLANSARALAGPGGLLLNGCFLADNKFTNDIDNVRNSQPKEQIKLLITNLSVYAITNAIFDALSDHNNKEFQGLKWMLMFNMVCQASLNATIFHGLLENFNSAIGIKKGNNKIRTTIRLVSGALLLSIPVVAKILLSSNKIDNLKQPLLFYLLYSTNDLFGPYATYPFMFGKMLANLSKNFVFDEKNKKSCVAESKNEKIRLGIYGLASYCTSIAAYGLYRMLSYYLQPTGIAGEIVNFILMETVLSCASLSETMSIFRFLEWTLNSIPHYSFNETAKYSVDDLNHLKTMKARFETLRKASLLTNAALVTIQIASYYYGQDITLGFASILGVNAIGSITAISSRKIKSINKIINTIGQDIDNSQEMNTMFEEDDDNLSRTDVPKPSKKFVNITQSCPNLINQMYD